MSSSVSGSLAMCSEKVGNCDGDRGKSPSGDIVGIGRFGFVAGATSCGCTIGIGAGSGFYLSFSDLELELVKHNANRVNCC